MRVFGRWAGRAGVERGATLVEYALVLAFLVGGSLGAIDYLTDTSQGEVTNQANCIEQRPPKPECQTAPLIPTTTTTGPAPTPPPPPPPPDPSSTTWSGGGLVPDDVATTTDAGTGQTTVSFTVDVANTATPGPYEGVLITVSWVITQPANNYPAQEAYCTTDASGTCTIDFTPPFTGVSEVKVSFVSAQPGGGTPPGDFVVTFP